MAFFGKASIIEGCPYDPIGAQLRFHQSKEQIMSRFRLVLCVGMLIVLIGWLQDALAQGTQPSEAASRPFVWPPSDIVPHNLAVSTFGARPPFPRGMQQGTASLRPEKLDQQAIDMLHAGGFRYANIWIEWSRVEQQKGRYDFSLYEQYVAQLQTKGLRPIFTFCFGNFLYCEGKPTNLTECICDEPLNTEQQRVAFANFAAAAAKHFTFKSTGAVFELWNEPNLEFFWMGKPNPAEFTAFAIRAADAMHHADPNAVVVGPGSSRGITDFVEKHGILGLMDRLANGTANLFNVLFRILYPYLFIFIPFGILFSIRPIDQKLRHVKANWIMILVLIGVLVIPFTIIDERRYLFPLFPFLIILSTIPIQRITNYGLNIFSFNDRQKSVFLVIIGGIVLLLSSVFTTGVTGFGYGPPNSVLEHEKIEFAEYLVENFDGRILRDEGTLDYLAYVSLTSDENIGFKEFKSPRGKDPYPDLYKPGNVVWVPVIGKTMEELVTNGEVKGLKYITIPEKGSYFFPFLNDLYHNEEKYPYMKKIFDSDEINYKEFKVKAFEIDYKNFHESSD